MNSRATSILVSKGERERGVARVALSDQVEEIISRSDPRLESFSDKDFFEPTQSGRHL